MAKISSTYGDGGVAFAAKDIVLSRQTGTFNCVATGGTFQDVGNGFSITIPKDGLYRISCEYQADISWASIASQHIFSRLAVDDAEIDSTCGVTYKNVSSGSLDVRHHVEAPIQMFTAGQVITLQAFKTEADPARIYYNAGTYEGFIQAEMLASYVPIIDSTNTAWQIYALTIGAVTTPPTKGTIAYDQAVWRRNGANMEIMYTYRQTGVGTAGSGTYLFPIPAGYTIDTTLMETISASGYNTTGICGTMACFNGSNHYPGTAHVYNSTNIQLMYSSSASPVSSAAMSLNSAANLTISYKVSVPILGWS